MTALTATMLLSAQLSAGAIVAHAKEVDLKIRDLSARVRMEITVKGEAKHRVFRLMMRREGVDYRALITLLEPVAMEETRFLVVAERGSPNRQWAYFPDLDLVRPIAGRDQDDPFLGSDISYADLAGGAHLDDLAHRLVGEEDVEGVPCYVMEGIPRHRITYGKLRGWVRKDNFLTIRAVFYDEDGKPVKQARLTDVHEVDGVPIAHRIEMENLVAQSGTVLTLGELRINLGLPLELFSEDSLGAAEN